jgi:hypothetical protein
MSKQPNSAEPANDSAGATQTLTARQMRGSDAAALADLTAIFDDLQFVLGCCERLVGELGRGGQRDPVVSDSVWIAALSTYGRCFRSRKSGAALTKNDLSETGLKGDVLKWHELLGKLRDFHVDGITNPREEFFVGASQSEAGAPAGVVVTSIPRPSVDETTVRQTGRLAFELSALVDKRIKDRTEKVFAEAQKLSAADFDKLDPINVDWSPASTPAQ